MEDVFLEQEVFLQIISGSECFLLITCSCIKNNFGFDCSMCLGPIYCWIIKNEKASQTNCYPTRYLTDLGYDLSYLKIYLE